MLSLLLTNMGVGEKIVAIFAVLIAMVSALVIHEWAHGYAAYKNGDLTAKMMGRLTLNPLKHLDPIGSLMLLMVGFGWAKPVPINPNNFNKYKKGMITTSVAGVSANLIMACINACCLAAVYAILKAVNYQVSNDFLFYLAQFFLYLFRYGMLINLTLMAFNILPIYPLDGFHVVEVVSGGYNGYCRFMRKYGHYLLLGILLLSTLLGRYLPYLDIIGSYINAIQSGFDKLFTLIFGVQY